MEEQVFLFIETGANVGSTLAYVARKYPDIQCFSCEPDCAAFQRAKKNTEHLPNVTVRNTTSPDFLRWLAKQCPDCFSDALFWLDAHGRGFKWPLKEEVAFISANCASAYILIDDFKVPGLDAFGYDEYGGQECSFDYIKDVLQTNLEYRLYYPRYVERTSSYHPLRGWGLIEFGHSSELSLPRNLHGKVTSRTVVVDSNQFANDIGS
jgi:hypothetical protein